MSKFLVALWFALCGSLLSVSAFAIDANFQYRAKDPANNQWFPWRNSAAEACTTDYLNDVLARPANTGNGRYTYTLVASYETACAFMRSDGASLPFDLQKSEVASCPENAEKTGDTCVCKTGYVEKNGKCEPSKNCRFSDTASAGYFDAGTDTAAGPSIMACVGGCETVFDGEFPSGSALVKGQKHYYASGSYIKTGRECTAPDSDIGKGIPTTEIPPDTCADGYVMGKVGGKSTCAKSGAGEGAKSDAKADPKESKTSTNTETKKDKDADGNDRETTTTTKKNADGSTTTETTVKITKGDGNGGTTTTTTSSTVTTGGSGKGSGSGSGSGDDDGDDDGDKEKGKCEKNSSDEGCGGAAASVDGKTFYTAKEKTFSGVLSKASTDLRGSGIGGAFTGFFNVASGGACPVAQWHIPFLNANWSFDVMCQPFALNALLVLKGVLLVIASFMAFRIAFE